MAIPLHPILPAMIRNKLGAMLISLQIAVTAAILCNALFIIQQQLSEIARPSGTDEANLFAITNDWIPASGAEGTPGDEAARVRNDLAALRAIPGVIGAYVTNSYPLTDSGSSSELYLTPPEQGQPAARTAVYYGDQQMLRTLGLRLIAGRDFTSTDVLDRTTSSQPLPDGVIVTQALAHKLFPRGSALGQRIYYDSGTRTTPIIGIVARLQTPWVTAPFGSSFIDNSMLVPQIFVGDTAHYVVRAEPGRLVEVMQAAQKGLLQTDPDRVIDKMQPFSAARARVYRGERGYAVILAAVCVVLLAVLASGIVGLTSYWVSQRWRQIGIRRALGATRPGIVGYFQTENLLIVAAGSAIGVAIGLAANLWMVQSSALARLPVAYLIVGVIVMFALGQIAVLWPALRAASAPPAVVARSV